MSKRNCIKCNRWRPLIDFRPYYNYKLEKEYLRKKCRKCYRDYYKNKYWEYRDKEFPLFLDPKPIMFLAKSMGYNKTQISKMAKVDVRRVRDWTNKKVNMSYRAADNLCIALDVPINLVYEYE